MPSERADIHNFAAGPSPLPTPVLHKAAEGLLNYDGTGMGVCELSHRGKEFMAIVKGAEANLRELLAIPDTHAVFFTQGGGTQQFSSTLLNILSYHRLRKTQLDQKEFVPPTVDYVVTGSWSSKAAAEAKRLVVSPIPGAEPFAKIHVAASTKATGFNSLPPREAYDFSFKSDAAEQDSNTAFVYYCENETINGVEFPADPAASGAFPFDLIPAHVPIVADYSSSFISRPIPHVERHAVIYAGAQKNLGPAGTTVVIVRKDLLVDTTEALLLGNVPAVPIELEYKTLADNGSLYNTPPVFAIYVSALVLEYLLQEKGGIKGVGATNEKKAKKLYEALARAEEKNVLRTKVKQPEARSWMNVTFEVVSKEGEDREKEFLAEAEKRGFRQIKGHRSIGGIRASLYNAVTEESVDALVKFIDEFVANHA
ncbi:hypothetical protein NliqN6_4175 [Naganishia liquefaciens]|uniref:phosphoserine transaminase n=1 Tax=Naganishia liquefaciens TaxID=104408 RepID=A0A8H3YFZ3_9TREE|nr:hypothetical protein NliqN6_4175 [Naganishia liquefaciens]